MLIDAGPMVSMCAKSEPGHARLEEMVKAANAPSVSTWVCFGEAMHILGRMGGFYLQRPLWKLVGDGLVRLHEHTEQQRSRMAALMDRYQNVPMDLGDASLVAIAESLQDRAILTLDSDFRIYRLLDGSAFHLLPESP